MPETPPSLQVAAATGTPPRQRREAIAEILARAVLRLLTAPAEAKAGASAQPLETMDLTCQGRERTRTSEPPNPTEGAHG